MPLNRYADAIASIESGGRYDRVGPTHPRYGRALGRYQVMESNLPEWLSAAGLPRMTGDEFLASPEAQDAVFRHRFGQYVQRHGPEGAARAWFAGEGGMGDPTRQDSLGTSVAEYARRFTAALGGQPPPTTMPPTTRGITPPPTTTPPRTDTTTPGTQPPPTGQAPPPDVRGIVAELLAERERAQQPNPAAAIATAAATDIEPLRLPSMAPRRPVSMQQIRAGLARRIGV